MEYRVEGHDDYPQEDYDAFNKQMNKPSNRSDGSSADYYKIPSDCSELQHLISFKNMNAQIGEIFRSCYRYGSASHSDQLRDAKKIKFYIEAEIDRLLKYNGE